MSSKLSTGPAAEEGSAFRQKEIDLIYLWIIEGLDEIWNEGGQMRLNRINAAWPGYELI